MKIMVCDWHLEMMDEVKKKYEFRWQTWCRDGNGSVGALEIRSDHG